MKTKLRWEYPPLSDLVNIEVRDIYNTGESTFTLLRPCQYGFDKQGRLVKKLYCTPAAPDVNPLFFATKGDGWSEQLPCYNHKRRKDAGLLVGLKNKGGGYDCPFMSNFGQVPCHRAVAYAWGEHPKEAETDPLWYKHFECDHLNGDHANFCPENLRWLTPEQNRAWDKRCGREQHKDGAHKGKTLRGISLDPKRIPYSTLRQISDLSDLQFETFLSMVQETFASDTRELSIDNMNDDIQSTVDWIINHTIHCARCGCEMIEDTEEHHTHYGTLCDCCYDDLYS